MSELERQTAKLTMILSGQCLEAGFLDHVIDSCYEMAQSSKVHNF